MFSCSISIQNIDQSNRSDTTSGEAAEKDDKIVETVSQ